MNTIHDLGGLDGLTLPERDQGRILNQEWERQLWGVALTAWAKPMLNYRGGSRADIERIPPALYLKMPYYAKWLWAEEVSLVRSGIVTWEELENPDGPVAMPDTSNFTPTSPDEVVAYMTADESYEIPAEGPPKFSVGDEVIARNEHPAGHTRMPRYVRGHRGVIHKHHGVHGFQDDVDGDVGQQHIYTVMFTGTELWGSRAHPNDRVYAELWDYHLRPAA
jgi:nitrile hydratase beta subunit